MIAREGTEEIFYVQYSKDDKLLAAGTGNGNIRIYNTDTGKITSTIVASYSLKPIMSLRYKYKTE